MSPGHGYTNWNPVCPDNPAHGRMLDVSPYNMYHCPHIDHARKATTGMFPNPDYETPKQVVTRMKAARKARVRKANDAVGAQ